MHRLSSLDAQFLAAEVGNFGAQYCGVAIYDTDDQHTISAVTMTKLVEDRIHLCPPLRWRLVTVPLGFDHPVFVDTQVDLTDHISESTLPEAAGDLELAAEVAEIMATRLERDRPLWRLRVIHGLPGRTAVVMTLHHAAADGIAASEIFSLLLDQPDNTAPRSTVPTTQERPNRAALAIEGLLSLPLRSVRAAMSVPKVLAHLDQVPSLRSVPGVHSLTRAINPDAPRDRLDAPSTRFNAPLTPDRSVAFGSVSLRDVKAVKNAFGVTVNDVVIAICGGALRRRLQASGELPEQPLVAYLPVSVRDPAATQRYGNAISSIIAPIPTHQDRPSDRIAFAHEWLRHAKARMRQAPKALLSAVNDPIPAPVFGLAARGVIDIISSGAIRPPINLIISNVPGSPVGLKCFGRPLTAHFPMSVIFDGFTLNITVVSYQDQLDIGIVGDAATLPDAWELLADMSAELDELVAAAPAGR
ncbi:wax ester/triacylglycerol synthase family O-acyltransferase [Mycolicibacterium sp. P9-22]|uniref:wax ester/triacylglycerol synthase family O-acyltransferase n=1 Tax=Mycolicibacterium sp. P9-22 TaxID=2024613 RepID=UPI0011EC3C2E|nr:wax ester/triacylglycerol synthase family O-acyltransferase [Mycolicibacterium sp. P9-22]KAA0120549.1 wax ester/triacylglycerol synthase family O-acyltransferase [Mycolicibacterium sp. P9-22]